MILFFASNPGKLIIASMLQSEAAFQKKLRQKNIERVNRYQFLRDRNASRFGAVNNDDLPMVFAPRGTKQT